ncbi:MAG: hypothetical protein ABIV51_12465, partial [Saprospiraceae bacterium]
MSNLVYYNEKQIEFLQAPQIDKNFICARGLGKTSVISGSTAMKIARLPMAKIFFAAPTYNQILTKTLPPIEEKWNEMGLIEHRPKRPGHYVIGQKPPEGWARAWKEP